VAHPFGGHPTLSRFVEFAKEQGCEAKLYYRTAKSGRAYQVLRIDNPDGCWVIVANPDFTEHLPPSSVAYLERRLNIKTHFASTPETSSDGE
jgi:hypothetical protein